MKRLVMFLDESGDHSLVRIDPQYPMFVLVGVVFDAHYHDTAASEMMASTKRQLFGRDDVILHTLEITRNLGDFRRMKEPAFRQRVYEGLNRLMAQLDYTVLACGIRKDVHLSRYGISALDPYMLALECLVERFVFMLTEAGAHGQMIAESRSAQLDNQLELAFLNLKINGSRYVSGARIKQRIEGLRIRDKSENLAGLQVADLAASPIGRKLLGKQTHQDYRIVEGKFRRRGDEYRGYGLVVLPRVE